MINNRFVRGAALALLTGAFCTPLFAGETISGAYIQRITHEVSNFRGPGGRAWIALDRVFPLTGGCMYSGAVNTPAGWMLELHVEHGSYKAILATALAAYTTGRPVKISYDDGFGPGTTCRITSLSAE